MQHICYSRVIMLSDPREWRDAENQVTIDQIAEQVVEALREELEGIAAGLLAAHRGEQLTVEQVAARLGVARSTVYSHWREWGGYKLGTGAKSPIRFDADGLPITRTSTIIEPATPPKPARRRDGRKRARREFLTDAPRLMRPFDAAS
jgi:transposase-like protein